LEQGKSRLFVVYHFKEAKETHFVAMYVVVAVVDVRTDCAHDLPATHGHEELNFGVLIEWVLGRIKQSEPIPVDWWYPVAVVAVHLPGELGKGSALRLRRNSRHDNIR
jgi:hypothetical protein